MIRWAEKQKGFTIVELLIVIVVIGILAAIVIVAFNGIQNRANDTALKSDLTNFAKKIEADRAVRDDNLYVTLTATQAANLGLRVTKSALASGNNMLWCRANTGDAWALAAQSKSGNAFYISSSSPTPTAYTWSWTQAQANTCPNIITDAYSPTWGTGTSGWMSTI